MNIVQAIVLIIILIVMAIKVLPMVKEEIIKAKKAIREIKEA